MGRAIQIDLTVGGIKFNDDCDECQFIKDYQVFGDKVCPMCGIDRVTGERTIKGEALKRSDETLS